MSNGKPKAIEFLIAFAQLCNFMDAVGILEAKISERGGKTIGHWSIDSYDFNESKAVKSGKFVGLAIDEDNQSELTDERIKGWVAQVKQEFG